MASLQTVKEAIKHVESRGNYGAIGKTTATGNNAYGAYQVMDFNIPNWSREALGYSVTPAQFLASPQIQEKVATYKIGQYLKQYGNMDDVASVWFSGRPMKKAGNAQDITGTNVPSYVSMVRQAARAGQASVPEALFVEKEEQPETLAQKLRKMVERTTKKKEPKGDTTLVQKRESEQSTPQSIAGTSVLEQAIKRQLKSTPVDRTSLFINT